MKTQTHISTFPSTARLRSRGFALIVTLSLMILLTVIAVGLLTLSSVSLRSSSQANARTIAQANAKMALMLAIGDLQKHAGPDQRITAEASILEKDSSTNAQPHWVGVWNSTGANASATPLTSGPRWLVSGAQDTTTPDPANPPGGLFNITSGDNANPGVGVPLQNIVTRKGAGTAATSGRYAYWVSDEGAKARVNLTPPADVPLANLPVGERMARSILSQSYAINKAGEEWKDVTDAEMKQLVSLNSSSLVTEGNSNEVPKKYQYDLTSEGYGLPVNVSAGGFRKDLSTIFDDRTLGPAYLGAEFSPNAAAGKVPFTVTDPSKYYLLDAYAAKNVGPNWGIFYNYHDLRRWNDGSLVGTMPGVQTDLRTRDWPPYHNATSKYGSFNFADLQHQNSQIGPVLSVFRVGFRLSAVPSGAGKYQLRLHVKPIIGLWNPYNVKLQPNNYTIIWATCSFLKLKIDEPGGATREPRLWLREIAVNTGGATPGSVPQHYSQMNINNIPFEPGEFRSFSVGSSVVLGNSNVLLPKLNGKEAFFSNLTWKGGGSNTPPPGAKGTDPMVIPAGSRVSISEMYFDDLQASDTKSRWPAIKDADTTSYFVIRSSAGDLCRFSDMWVTSNGSQAIPEKFVGLFPTKTVETLASSVTDPDASWEFRLRTSDESQRTLRNWVDSNPRGVVMNPRWDGSNGSSGWWYTSPYSGGGPTGMGLVLDPTFQSTTGGSFNHFGGNSAEASGQTRVASYDVPRAPLVSLAQFQHALVSRYNFEPSFAVGNSSASMRMPLNATSAANYAGVQNFTLVDSSYELNRKLWDDWFFSTLSGSFKGGNADADTAYPLASVKFSPRLPNPRNIVIPQTGDTKYAEIKSKSDHPAEAISSRIGIMGAFNINSTSKVAWKTLLASMAANEIPTVSGNSLTWSKPGGTLFSHFSAVVDPTGAEDDATDAPYWLSYRKVDDAELDSLADEIVKEVKARGPFRSLAGFINRSPGASNPDHQRKGALQAALDRVLNAPVAGAGDLAPVPGMNNDAFDATEKQAAGSAAYVTQADVLQTIGPVIQARSDCFRIRAMGQALANDGKTILSQAVCEAYIQRVASYVDPSDAPEIPSASPTDASLPNPDLLPANQNFGRGLKLISFRWLDESEI